MCLAAFLPNVLRSVLQSAYNCNWIQPTLSQRHATELSWLGKSAANNFLGSCRHNLQGICGTCTF